MKFNIYKNINGLHLSLKIKNKLTEKKNKYLIYEEINYNSMLKNLFYIINSKIHKNNKNFCNPESGSSIIIFSAILFILYDNFNSYYGVELLKELYDKFNLILNNFNNIN